MSIPYDPLAVELMNQSMSPDVRPYVFEIMNHLVTTHAQVCSVAEGLLDRTLNAILDDIVKEFIRCFGQVKRFGTGGLLTVRRFTCLPCPEMKFMIT